MRSKLLILGASFTLVFGIATLPDSTWYRGQGEPTLQPGVFATGNLFDNIKDFFVKIFVEEPAPPPPPEPEPLPVTPKVVPPPATLKISPSPLPRQAMSVAVPSLSGEIQELPGGRIPGLGNGGFPGGLSSLAYTNSQCPSGRVAVGAGVYPSDLPYGDARIVGIDCQQLTNTDLIETAQRYPGQNYHLEGFDSRRGSCPSGSALVGVEVYDPSPSDDTDNHDFAIYCKQIRAAQFTGSIVDVPGGSCPSGRVAVGAAFYDPAPTDDTDNRSFTVHCQQLLTSPQNRAPDGAFLEVRSASCRAVGWANDPDGGNPVQVHLYADALAGQGGTLVGAGSASASGYGSAEQGFDGFDIMLNAPLFQNGHQLFAYALDAQGGPSQLLIGSPKNLICPVSCLPTIPPWPEQCVNGLQTRTVRDASCNVTPETRQCPGGAGTQTTPPSCSATLSQASANPGTPVTLRVRASGMNSLTYRCSPDWSSGSLPATNGTASFDFNLMAPNQTTSCTFYNGDTGTSCANTTLTVSEPTGGSDPGCTTNCGTPTGGGPSTPSLTPGQPSPGNTNPSIPGPGPGQSLTPPEGGQSLRGGGALPPFCLFRANPDRIRANASSTLSWECVDTNACNINQGIGAVDFRRGTSRVRPSRTTDYDLRCTGPGGSGTWPARVWVDFAPRIEEVIPRF